MDLQTAVALSLLPRGLGAALVVLSRSVRGSLDLQAVMAEVGISPSVLDPVLPLADRALARARQAGLVPLGWADAGYPGVLLETADPPPALWVNGDPVALRDPAAALVGSRNATPHGREMARMLAIDLARAGVLVISGLARGIDAAAHQGALAGGGSTVAVLGCGADVVYPAEHRDLRDAVIAGGGAVVSELPPGTPPRAWHFPRRNRIISGLSRVVVVVEASERSGSLITAGWALDQGREVMAVPGSVLTGRNRGAHALLRDGAAPVESAADVLPALGMAGRPGAGRAAVAPAGGVLDALEPGEAWGLDALCRRTGRPGATLLAELMELELAGLVRREGGGFVRSR